MLVSKIILVNLFTFFIYNVLACISLELFIEGSSKSLGVYVDTSIESYIMSCTKSFIYQAIQVKYKRLVLLNRVV